jgi:hypothetical protein
MVWATLTVIAVRFHQTGISTPVTSGTLTGIRKLIAHGAKRSSKEKDSYKLFRN